MARPKKATTTSSTKTVKTSAVTQYQGLEFTSAITRPAVFAIIGSIISA